MGNGTVSTVAGVHPMFEWISLCVSIIMIVHIIQEVDVNYPGFISDLCNMRLG